LAVGLKKKKREPDLGVGYVPPEKFFFQSMNHGGNTSGRGEDGK